MDMLTGEQIAAANLTDWRKLAQGLHARYVVDNFGTGARFVTAVGEAGDALGHYPRVSIGRGYVDLKLVSDDAIYRDDEGTEHVVEWVTQQDVSASMFRTRSLRSSTPAPSNFPTATTASTSGSSNPSAHPGDLPAVRAAAIETFARRQKQSWPPTVTIQPSWSRDYPNLITNHPDAPDTIETAISYLTGLIRQINDAK